MPELSEDRFDRLLRTAMGEWPDEIELPVGFRDTYHIVEGLTELGKRISSRWAGDAQEVLMRTMHWTILTSVHNEFRCRTRVRPGELETTSIRLGFETRLRQIGDDLGSGWDADDLEIIRAYFETGV